MNRRVKYIIYVIDADMINTVAMCIITIVFFFIDRCRRIRILEIRFRGRLKGLLSRCGKSKLTTVRQDHIIHQWKDIYISVPDSNCPATIDKITSLIAVILAVQPYMRNIE